MASLNDQKAQAAQNSEKLFLADLELAKREARRGEPWEFIRLQWPNLILSSEDRPFFKTDLRLDDAQIDILQYLFAEDHTEEFIKGCTKRGKGFAVALGVNIWFDVFDNSKIILTGPSSDHVKDNLFGEVAALRRQMVRPANAEIQTEAIRAGNKHYIIIANPKSGEGFSGQHSEYTLFVFDEASAAVEFYYTNAKKQARFIIALSNPRILSGWFRDGYKSAADPDITQSVPTSFGTRRLITAGGADTVNVREKRLEKPFAPHDGFEIGGRAYRIGQRIPQKYADLIRPLIPAQVDYARYMDIMSSPDESSRRIFGEGKFPKEDASLQVILGSWLQLHKDGWTPEIIVCGFGLDVGASVDGDSTVLAPGGPRGLLPLHATKRADTMQTVGWVLDTAWSEHGIRLTDGSVPIAVDYGGGYGRGVGDRLREQGVMVISVHPNTRSKLPLKYENMRAEIYGELGHRLNPEGPWGDRNPWGLPDDPLLFEELTAQEKVPGSDGVKFGLIPKTKPHPRYTGKTLEDILHRSPDRSDAVALLWRAISMTAAMSDFSDRHLVHTLDVPEPDEPDLTPEEKWKRERDKHLSQLAAVMDGDDESPSWR